MTPFEAIRPLLDDVSTQEPMRLHTSFKIGGPADVLARPKNAGELQKIRDVCEANGLPLMILGDGTNVLVSDAGIRGVVVLTNRMNGISVSGSKIRAEAGARLSRLADAACKAGLGGLAFASGIPGTVGGAVFMNAGAYGHEIKDFCETVTLLTDEGIVERPNAEMSFGYRKSAAQDGKTLVLSVVFALEPGDPEEIRREMSELNARRRETQPLEFPSAGSTFKRPEGHYAAKLIQDCGLKGFAIGGAKVSEKHAGFIINTGDATAKDVVSLIEEIQKRVFEVFGVKLETEVRILCE